MKSVAVEAVMGQLPMAELEESVQAFIEPITRRVPDERFRRGVGQAILGIVGSRSPVVCAMAQGVACKSATVWAQAKRIYRLLASPRFKHGSFYEGIYEIGQRIVAEQQPTTPDRPAVLVVAIDPVQFEKPYTKHLEGVSTVHKSTPPGPKGQPRLTSGYPALTATVVNTPVPAITYLDWFSYTTADFISQPDQLYRAIRTTARQFPEYRLRFVADSGLDDQKVFDWIDQVKGEFILRACHLDRLVEPGHPAVPTGRRVPLETLVNAVAPRVTFRVGFQHAGRLRLATIQLGWAPLLVPVPAQAVSSTDPSAAPDLQPSSDRLLPLWVLVAREVSPRGEILNTLVLLTNLSVETVSDAQIVYEHWRWRSRIEHVYRFDQEQGVDVEDLRVQTLERMRRLFALVATAVLFVFWIMETWPEPAVLWLRHLGGKLERSSDRDGPYLLLRGLAALQQTAVTLTFLADHPFPRETSPPFVAAALAIQPLPPVTYG